MYADAGLYLPLAAAPCTLSLCLFVTLSLSRACQQPIRGLDWSWRRVGRSLPVWIPGCLGSVFLTGTLEPLNPRTLSCRGKSGHQRARHSSRARLRAGDRPWTESVTEKTPPGGVILSASEGPRLVRVKKCGKSALSRVETSGMDKPCLVQDQYENRACPARYDSRVGRLRPAGNCGSRQMTVASHGVQNPAYRPASICPPSRLHPSRTRLSTGEPHGVVRPVTAGLLTASP